MLSPKRAFVYGFAALSAAALTFPAAAEVTKQCKPTALHAGTPLSLEKYRGKVLYVDFWASWCAPCKMSFPFMNELKQEFSGRKFEIVAISLDKEQAPALKFAKAVESTFPLGLDTTGACPESFGVDGMPSSYVVGPDGQVLYEHTGFRNSDKDEIRNAISKALGS